MESTARPKAQGVTQGDGSGGGGAFRPSFRLSREQQQTTRVANAICHAMLCCASLQPKDEAAAASGALHPVIPPSERASASCIADRTSPPPPCAHLHEAAAVAYLPCSCAVRRSKGRAAWCAVNFLPLPLSLHPLAWRHGQDDDASRPCILSLSSLPSDFNPAATPTPPMDAWIQEWSVCQTWWA